MTGEFSAACARFYRLTELLAKQELYFEKLLAEALPYTGQTDLKELDAIISCNRKIQKIRADANKTEADLRDANWLVIQIIKYFEIPPNTRLQAEIPEEAAFDIWADEDNQVHYEKTADLDPEEDNPNIITIKICTDRYGYKEEDWE